MPLMHSDTRLTRLSARPTSPRRSLKRRPAVTPVRGTTNSMTAKPTNVDHSSTLYSK